MKRILSVIFLVFIFFSIKAVLPNSTEAQTVNCTSGFSTLFSGVQYKKTSITTPRLNTIYIARIDLSNSNIDLMVTPRSGLGTTTSQFLFNYSANLAVNGDESYSPTDPKGLAAAEGDIYSASSPEPSFFIDQNNDVRFFGPRPGNIWDAISGSHTVVRNGQIAQKLRDAYNPSNGVCSNPTYCSAIHPRTVIGLTGSNQLILMVVDGRQPGYSEGVTLYELANLMLSCNARSAINMDGGGSSTMVRSGVGVLNRPSDGSERQVANHFGVCNGPCNNGQPLPGGPPTYPNPEGDPRPRFTVLDPYPFPCNRRAPEESGFTGLGFSEDEFHSLRPYQASPCNQNLEDLALFCGNNIVIGDNFTITKTFTSPTGSEYSSDPNPPGEWGLHSPCYFCNESGACVQNTASACIPEANQCTPGDPNACGPCEVSTDGTFETCVFTVNRTRNIAIDLEDAELPIMGYTEPSRNNLSEPDPQVVNSMNPIDPSQESLTHPDKVNEYVSWYLNGVIGRAEYPPLDAVSNCIGETSGRAGICESTNPYISPLPDPFRRYNCRLQINPPPVPNINPDPDFQFDGKSGCGGTDTLCCVPDEGEPVERLGRDELINFSGPIKKLLPLSIQHRERISEAEDAFSTRDPNLNTNIRHDQVAGCVWGVRLWIPIVDFDFNVGGIPAPCYTQNVLSWLFGLTPRVHLSDWIRFDKTPPLEEQSPDLQAHLLDYQRWRGQFCVILFTFDSSVPLIGGKTIYACFDNPLEPNFYSMLFANIPFSSTEDRLGDVEIEDFSVQPVAVGGTFRIISTELRNQEPAFLYFPHMQESYELADTLQKTYAYKDSDLNADPTEGIISPGPFCDVRQVRTNPGDDLFAGEITATLDYTAQVSCTFALPGDGRLCQLAGGQCIPNGGSNTYCDDYYGFMDCPSGQLCASGCTTDSPSEARCGNDWPGYSCVPDNFNCFYDSPCEQFPTDPRCTGIAPPPTCGNSNYKCGIICARPITNPFPLTQACTRTAFVHIKTETNTPLAKEVWAKLVSGPAGIFKRIFPKIGEGGALQGLWDMPTSTSVVYTTEADQTFAGDPTVQRPGISAELYFPHIGGVKEYFLTGIQTILRPKGFGYQIADIGDQPPPGSTLPPGTGTCSLGTGYCDPQYLLPFFDNDLTAATYASQICQCESGSNQYITNPGCTTGQSCDYSVGLFQINQLGRCPLGISSYTCDFNTGLFSCTISSQSELQACVNSFTDPNNNILYAKYLYDRRGGSFAGDWGFCSTKCNVP